MIYLGQIVQYILLCYAVGMYLIGSRQGFVMPSLVFIDAFVICLVDGVEMDIVKNE